MLSSVATMSCLKASDGARWSGVEKDFSDSWSRAPRTRLVGFLQSFKSYSLRFFGVENIKTKKRAVSARGGGEKTTLACAV